MIWLIGSRAVKHHLKNKMYRRCNDYDLMCSPDELENIKISLMREGAEFTATESPVYPGKSKLYITGFPTVEIDATNNASRVLLSASTDIPYELTKIAHIGTVAIPSLQMLYAIKRTHANIPLHTEKTIADLINLGRILFGAETAALTLTPSEQILYDHLAKEALERDKRRASRIKFNVPAADFFKQSEKFRQYTHDKVHDITARETNRPLFRENLVYPDRALIDMSVFATRSLDYQLTMAREEAIVIGIEREYLNDRNLSPQIVYRRGMIKLIRDLSKGRFQNFLLDNIHILAEMPSWDFMGRFLQAEEQGYFEAG